MTDDFEPEVDVDDVEPWEQAMFEDGFTSVRRWQPVPVQQTERGAA